MLLVPSQLIEVRNHLKPLISQQQMGDIQAFIKCLPDWRMPRGYMDLGKAFIRKSGELQKFYDSPTFDLLNKMLIVELALKLPSRIQEQHIPESLLPLYREALERLSVFLMTEPDTKYFYPNEYFVKDLRFAAGLTIPCGALVVDMRNIIGWKPGPGFIIKNRLRDIVTFIKYYRKKPWLRAHVESRYLDEFNEAGFEVFYSRVASLLKAQPQVHGLAISSWFYDTTLEGISPHLNYLWRHPLERGAFIVRGSTSPLDIASATFKSKRRRQMVEEGSYKPMCCMMIWPRDRLLQWHETKADRL